MQELIASFNNIKSTSLRKKILKLVIILFKVVLQSFGYREVSEVLDRQIMNNVQYKVRKQKLQEIWSIQRFLKRISFSLMDLFI